MILQKTAQLEQHISTVQQLNTQLREKDKELQQKETQLQQRSADISRLQRELQVSRVHNKREKKVVNGPIAYVECVQRVTRLECNYSRTFSTCVLCVLIFEFIVHGQFDREY